MLSFDLPRGRFNYRVAGIVIDQGHVLLNKFDDEDYWFLPGGRVEFGESAEEAIKRELYEEVRTEVEVEGLAWVVENFFELGRRRFHELGFYFVLSLPAGSSLHDKTRDHVGTEGTRRFVLRWAPLDDLKELELYPAFLSDGLRNLPTSTQHVLHQS